MKAPTATRLAWSLCAACVAGTVGGILLAVPNRHSQLRDVALALALLSCPVVGA